jgi:hypothetical protein
MFWAFFCCLYCLSLCNIPTLALVGSKTGEISFINQLIDLVLFLEMVCNMYYQILPYLG